MKIGRYNVQLQELTWWKNEEIRASLTSGAKMNNNGLSGFDGQALLDSKIKTFEAVIADIKEGDKSIPFSKEWVQGLTLKEGDALEEAVNEITKKK
jgi:hypothetical protein